MSQKISAFDAGSGKPNLEFLEVLQGIFSEAMLNQIVNHGLFTLEVDITSDTTTPVGFTLPLNAQIVDMWVIAQATSGSGSVTLKDKTNGTTLFTALAMATDGAIARAAAGAVAANVALLTEVGTGFTLTANGSGDRGRVFISYQM